MRPWIAAVLLVTAGAGEARAQPGGDRLFCTTLRQLLGAAGERPAFRSLGRRGPARAAAGLDFDGCRIVPQLYSDRLVCSRVAGPRNAGGPAVQARIERCLPRVLIMSEPEGSRFTRFRIGTLAFYLERKPRLLTFTLFALPIERR
jgi:hypothetical protein